MKHCTSSVINSYTASFSYDDSQSPAPLNISPSTTQSSSSNTTVNEQASTTSTSNQDNLVENLQDQQVRRITGNRREVLRRQSEDFQHVASQRTINTIRLRR